MADTGSGSAPATLMADPRGTPDLDWQENERHRPYCETQGSAKRALD